MVWKPAKALGLIVGLVILLTIVGIDAYLIQSMGSQGLGASLYLTALLFVLSLPLLGLWGYWYYELLSLQYTLDRNALVVAYGTCRHVIPLGAIRRIVPASEIGLSQGFHGIGWPGYLKGHVHREDVGLLLVHSTEPLERQLIVITNSLCYGISPSNPEQFLEDYAKRRMLGPIRRVVEGTEHARLLVLPVWRDRVFWLAIILAFVANIVLVGVIVNQYGELPERIPLHFDVQGQADHIASKSSLLLIPGIGALTLGMNTLLGMFLHRRARLGAHLLVYVALGIQAVLWLAAMGILTR